MLKYCKEADGMVNTNDYGSFEILLSDYLKENNISKCFSLQCDLSDLLRYKRPIESTRGE